MRSPLGLTLDRIVMFVKRKTKLVNTFVLSRYQFAPPNSDVVLDVSAYAMMHVAKPYLWNME